VLGEQQVTTQTGRSRLVSLRVILHRVRGGAMSETRKIAAILAADVDGFSRMASADENRTLARLRALRSELIDPTIAGQWS
jgi:class 3 adenylate cyclase